MTKSDTDRDDDVRDLPEKPLSTKTADDVKGGLRSPTPPAGPVPMPYPNVTEASKP